MVVFYYLIQKNGELRINIKKNQFLIKGEKEKLKLAKKDNKRLLRIYHYLMKRLEILNKISRGKLLRKEEIEFLQIQKKTKSSKNIEWWL